MDDSSTNRSHTSTPAVLGALLYTAARAADLGEGSASLGAGFTPEGRDQEIIDAVEAELTAQNPEESTLVRQTVTTLTAAIGAVRTSATKPSLTAAKYDAQRPVIIDELGGISTKGATVWPPTSQTAVQRFGSWNEALAAAGLATSRIGRAKGQLRFDAAAYERAIAGFLADCEARGVTGTYKAYAEYAAEHKGEVPSAAAVRKFFGSWNAALASAG